MPSERLQRALAASPALLARLQPSLLLQGEDFAAEAPAGSALFEALRGEFERAAPGRTEALQAQLLLLAPGCCARRPALRPKAARQALRDTLVQRYRALLELHLRRHRRLVFYAGQLGVTPDHLSRACRAVTGLSALDLQHERLLRSAPAAGLHPGRWPRSRTSWASRPATSADSSPGGGLAPRPTAAHGPRAVEQKGAGPTCLPTRVDLQVLGRAD